MTNNASYPLSRAYLDGRSFSERHCAPTPSNQQPDAITG